MSMLQLWTTTSVGSSWTPQIPTGLTATIIDDTHIDISWVNIAKEGDGTKLERSTDGITFSALFTNAAGVAIYHDTVTVGVVYFYRIYAYKGTVNSGYSSIYTVQTTHTVLADVFTGSTIDGSKWTETDPDNIISQNGQLILLSTSSNSTQLRNNIKSIASISNGIAVMQGKVTWSADSGVNYSGIYLYKDDNNFAFIGCGGTGYGNFTYGVYSAGAWGSGFGNLRASTIPKNKDVRIWTDGSVIYFEYWSGQSWIKIDSITKTLGTPYLALITSQQNNPTWNTTTYIDDVYLSSNKYIGHYPNDVYSGLSLIPTWSPQGTVLYGDRTSAPYGRSTACEPSIMYEGSPVIITGATNVFKMWYSNGYESVDEAAFYYAESLDGITWQKYSSNPLLTKTRCVDIIKSGGIYYAYATRVGIGSVLEDVDLYTSNDGVSFTLNTANVLVRGTGFDANIIANKTIIIEAGVWYMLYEAAPPAYRIGLATSNDGIHWTKYGTSAIIKTNVCISGPSINKVGSVYYLWLHGDGRVSGDGPSDIVQRYKSTDLLNWTIDTYDFVYKRATDDEGYLNADGQCADPFVLEINGKVYLFHSATVHADQTPPNVLHIKLAIYNGTLAQLIQTQEGRIP